MPSGISARAATDGMFIFRGIKYAKANRFEMPGRLDKSDDTIATVNFGYACPAIYKSYPHDMYCVPSFFYPESEDCLYMNIWTPTMDTGARLPVMIWLHDGDWETGHGMVIYSCDGENLSRHGNVVVISINHRLNFFGSLNLSEYGGKYRNSGCLCLADIVSALESVNGYWMRICSAWICNRYT